MLARPIDYFRVGLAAAALLLPLPALAVDPDLRAYSQSPELLIEAAGNSPANLRLRGNWPTPCLPVIDAIERDGFDIRIDLRSRKPLCARVPMPFDLTATIATPSGRELVPGTYRISVFAANSANAAPELRGFALVGFSETAAPAPASGFWWPQATGDNDKASSSTSFSIELQGSTLAVAVLGRTRQGESAWYFGTGQLHGRSAEIDLGAVRDQHAGALTPDASNAADGGLLHLEFESNARATAWLGHFDIGDNQPVLRQQKVALVHLPFEPTTTARSWQGDWVLVGATPGQPDSAQRLQLSVSGLIDMANYRLSASDGSQMACERDERSPQSPPRRCRLYSSKGELRADFDSIGIQRLDGHTPDGKPVQLLRIDHR